MQVFFAVKPSKCYTIFLSRIKNLKKKVLVVRSGIRTHAHRSGLRPERSALDHSAILTHLPTFLVLSLWLNWERCLITHSPLDGAAGKYANAFASLSPIWYCYGLSIDI